MTCEQASQRSTDYLEGALSTAQRWSFRAHLARCRHCRAELRQLRLTVSLLRRVGPPPVSEPARADVMAMFRRWQPSTGAPAPVLVTATERLLSALDRLLGGGRGLIALALVMLGSLALAARLRPIPGASEPAFAGLECLGVEMLAALLPLLAVGALAWHARRAVSGKVFAVTAALGALAGQAAIHASCPQAGLHLHAAFHVAGVLAAVLLGVIASSAQSALLRGAR
jgi:anti-sigma factor RsiW